MNSEATIKARLQDDGTVVQVLPDGSTKPLKAEVDWRAIDALTDEQIEAAIKDDPDAAPPLDEAWFREARARKQAISIRVDPDVLEWFKQHGTGYQTRMNAVLRAYMQAHRQQHQG